MVSSFLKKEYSKIATIFFFVANLFFISCKQEIKNTVNIAYDRETIPTMKTYFDTIQISDSGLIKYKVISEVYEVFDQAKDPHWKYPKGIYFEQFDSLFNIVVTVKADTAWNYTLRKLWRLKGNVLIRNFKNETFTSDEFFWDSRQQKIYSNVPVAINKPGEIVLRGSGFQSNQQLTNWQFTNVGEYGAGETLLYVNEDAENQEKEQE